MASGGVFEIADVPPEGPDEQNTPERVRAVYDIYFRRVAIASDGQSHADARYCGNQHAGFEVPPGRLCQIAITSSEAWNQCKHQNRRHTEHQRKEAQSTPSVGPFLQADITKGVTQHGAGHPSDGA